MSANDQLSKAVIEAARPDGDVKILSCASAFELAQEFFWQSWDDSRWTARGFELRASARTAGGFLGGSEEFNAVRLFGEVGVPLFAIPGGGTHALALRGRLGWAEEFGGSDFVPLTERFFIGGSRTLRGFEYQGVGPRDRNGDPTGGQAMWATSVEYRFPLWATESGDIGAGGLLFWDAGALAERITDDEFDDVRMSVGFGFRIYLPTLGRWPLALDVGFPVAKERDDERRILSISIGRRIL